MAFLFKGKGKTPGELVGRVRGDLRGLLAAAEGGPAPGGHVKATKHLGQLKVRPPSSP